MNIINTNYALGFSSKKKLSPELKAILTKLKEASPEEVQKIVNQVGTSSLMPHGFQGLIPKTEPPCYVRPRRSKPSDICLPDNIAAKKPVANKKKPKAG